MKVYKPTCPTCGGRNTTIRKTVREDVRLQVHYCDCLDDTCLTRFVVQSETTRIISTLREELVKKASKASQLDQLPLNLA
ncbi:hypothetical protein MW332_004630 [Vibrio parahaemolyticus]|uniref:hypothetical protein n=2 Tax=Vibrio parahaemolyticus TaxID=670 RepID=UPI0011AEE042|nr:hypothetical protein [Vibrio parahaemolyticus]EJB8454787.1 hypothetical protein [Vibrio parahaemolyticus]